MSEKKLTRYAADHNGYMVPTTDGPYVSAYTADTLLAERDAEIARLHRVIEDYGKQIRDRHQCDEMAASLAGQPQAWVVNCPTGHEYDAMVFPSQEEAEVRAETFNADCPEGESPHVAVPLYTTDQISQLTAHREAVRKAIDQFEYMAEYMREHGPFYNNADGEVASRLEELRAAFGGNT